MDKKEKDLFFSLCQFQNNDSEKIKELIQSGAASPAVLGELFWNRIAAVGYGVLQDNGLLSYTNREFRNSIKNAYFQNRIKNESFMKCLDLINFVLKPIENKYALLKGALLCLIYPKGFRTSNDIDILVSQADITEIGEKFKKEGFIQGSIKNGVLIPATREEIIKSRVMRGETIPYIKKVGLPFFEFLEIDINFSLDFKNGDQYMIQNLINRSVVNNECGIEIKTLKKEDFFLHLCAHLYKEATTYPWIKMKRDMTLYKYVDIYMLLNGMSEEEIDKITETATELKLLKEYIYTVKEVGELFESINEKTDYILNKVSFDLSYMLDVVYPEEKKLFRYTISNAKERFFSNNRCSILKEVGEWKN